MQPSQLAKYMRDPSQMGPDSVTELAALVEQFPYFQPAHLLLSIAARRWDAAVYQRSLKKTAIVVPDRARLFELIMDAEKMPDDRSEQSTASEAKAENGLTLLKVAEQVSEDRSAPGTAGEPKVKEERTEPVSGEQITRQIEKEVAKQIVAARVEKELLQPRTEKVAQDLPAASPASFGDWLSYLKKNNGQPYLQIEEEVRKEKARQKDPSAPQAATTDRRDRNKAILDSIIEKNPGHIKIKDEKFFTAETKAKESLLDNEHLVTETLARIYALQGNTSKAIRAYQILSLKNPQKSAYFAGLIEKLRNNEKPE